MTCAKPSRTENARALCISINGSFSLESSGHRLHRVASDTNATEQVEACSGWPLDLPTNPRLQEPNTADVSESVHRMRVRCTRNSRFVGSPAHKTNSREDAHTKRAERTAEVSLVSEAADNVVPASQVSAASLARATPEVVDSLSRSSKQPCVTQFGELALTPVSATH